MAQPKIMRPNASGFTYFTPLGEFCYPSDTNTFIRDNFHAPTVTINVSGMKIMEFDRILMTNLRIGEFHYIAALCDDTWYVIKHYNGLICVLGNTNLYYDPRINLVHPHTQYVSDPLIAALKSAADATARANEADETIEMMQDDLDMAYNEIDGLNADIDTANGEIDRLTADLDKANQEIAALRMELNNLRTPTH